MIFSENRYPLFGIMLERAAYEAAAVECPADVIVLKRGIRS